MKRYREKSSARRPSEFLAVRYDAGQSVDELHKLREVARAADPSAEFDESEALRVAIVRCLCARGHGPFETQYVIVESGSYLVYSTTHDILYAQEAASFERENEPA